MYGDWVVWGDRPRPAFEGTEEECKAFITEDPDAAFDLGLYIASPDGKEYVYETDQWTEA
jgi:hypothetical protein